MSFSSDRLEERYAQALAEYDYFYGTVNGEEPVDPEAEVEVADPDEPWGKSDTIIPDDVVEPF